MKIKLYHYTSSLRSSLYGKFRMAVTRLLLETEVMLMVCTKSIKLWWTTTIVSRAVKLHTLWRSTLTLASSSLLKFFRIIRSTLEAVVKK